MSTWYASPPPPRWHRWVPPWARRPTVWAVRIGVVLALVLGLVVLRYAGLAAGYDLSEVERMPARTVIHDRNGRELDLSLGTTRRLIARADIPGFMVNALVAREDARFFQHAGIDLRGMVRAAFRNLKDREFTQGASTLPMQLARNTFGIRAKSLHRKLLEIALTRRIESRYTKDEILTHYLNRIYFGAGCNGVEEAAQTYFGRSVRDLDENECALLVGIIRGPNVYSPFRSLALAEAQRDQVVERMVAMGFATDADRGRIRAQPLRLIPEEKRRPERSAALSRIRYELEGVLDQADIRLGGLHVFTTFDSAWQARLEGELERAVSALEAEPTWAHPTRARHQAGAAIAYVQFAAVTLETRTGAILALVGGRDGAESRFDRTALARRDLGSAFEPFIAAAAAERGCPVYPGNPVQTGRQVGASYVQRIARRCGLAGPFAPDEDLFRGVAAATPMEMAVGLATLGNDGQWPKPFLIREIRDAAGVVLYQGHPDLFRVLPGAAARAATGVLGARAGTRCFTGATGSERDAWMLRLGPKGATAIWLGFDQPAAITREDRLKALLDEFVNRLGNE